MKFKKITWLLALAALVMPFAVEAGDAHDRRDAAKDGKHDHDNALRRKIAKHVKDQVAKWKEEGLSDEEIATKKEELMKRIRARLAKGKKRGKKRGH